MKNSCLLKTFFLLGLFMMVGCSAPAGEGGLSTRAASPLNSKELEREFGKILGAKPGFPIAILWEHISAIEGLTRKTIRQGGQDALSELILAGQGSREKRPWYTYMEEEFAETLCRRNIPITMGATPKTVEALKAIAARGRTRTACVSAAKAIREEAPEIAKATFLKEYGNFTLSDYWPGRFYPSGSPLSVSHELWSMGVMVPREITSDYDALFYLTSDYRRKFGSERVLRATNMYNQKNRDLLKAQQWDELSKRKGEEYKMIPLFWEKAKTPPPAPKYEEGSGLFDIDPEEEEEGSGLFSDD